ncbi:TonB family protein [Pedobacter sp. UC225_65]|uniref:TonB family protein n=1 Tax=Pedobacter sp. UC225_65 TaxID=3350173 RepID=UPI00367135C6
MSWAHYLLQVNIYLVIFFCFYKLLLDKETYFVLNRIYLIASGVLSLAIPFLRFEWFNKQEVTQHIYTSVDQLNTLVTQATVVKDTTEKFNWGNLIVFIYLLGILFCLGRFIFQLVAVRRLLKTIGNGMAFSFLNKKVISNNLPESATVHLHEDIHVKQLHTLDVLFFEFLGIITWFNPIIYAYKNTIKNIHEYLADEAAAKFQGDKEEYAMLLLSQAFGVRPNSLTNGFFTKSLIKKRIFMLHKQRSKKVAILKYGLFVPLFALTLVLSSATIRKNDKILGMADKISSITARSFVKEVLATPLEVVDFIYPPPPKADRVPQQTLVYGDVVTESTESGNEPDQNALEPFYKHVFNSIIYPVNAAENKIQGNTIINFSVKNGRITDAIVQNELGYGLDQEVLKPIANYTDYIKKDGNYSLKATFKLDGADTPMQNENATTQDGYTPLAITITGIAPKEEVAIEKPTSNFVAVSAPPVFPGGTQKLNQFLDKKIKYPIAALDNDIQGTVTVNFIVEKDGSLSNLKTDRKLGFGLDEEAIRVLKLSKWLPAVQDGKTVRVNYSIPIKFALDQNKRESKASVIASIRLKNFPEGPNREPLFIVDGELKETGGILKELDANKIETIDVLKGASAIALYGKKGENGAIIITSKNPEKARVSATLFK